MPRFCQYLNKVFGFSKILAQVSDSRTQAQIPTQSIWASGLVMFWIRLGSLNALETELRVHRSLNALIGPQKPSADTIGRVFGNINSESLRMALAGINHQLKRNKTLAKFCSLRFAAVDGHELFCSRHRHCSRCCTRTIKVKGKKVTEYYHKAVVIHLIGYELAMPLDLEMIGPGEGELTAVRRLLGRVFKNYPRFFDAIVGDALYLNAPFFNFVRRHGKHVLAVLKGKKRVLISDAQALFKGVRPQEWEIKKKTIHAWDDEGFNSHEGMQFPLRVIHAKETEQKRERIAGQWKETERIVNWWWATTIPIAMLDTKQIWKMAHHRWDIENDLFNTLVTHWHLDHCFNHNPVAIENFVLTLFIAFVLIQSFYLRNLKPQLRRRLTLISIANQFYRSLQTATFAPIRAP